MSKEENWEDMFERLDSGDETGVSQEIKAEHALIQKSIQFIEEDSFRKSLETAHATIQDGKGSNAKIFWMVGIAASMAAFFWWTSFNTEPANFELQMDQAPTYADSASYDSLKKSEIRVDNDSKEELIEN